MKQIKIIYCIGLLLIVLLCLTSCGRRSLDDFREEGESVTRSLIQELRQIRTRQQLLSSSKKLQYLFNKLADIMIAAQEFRQKQKITEKSPDLVNPEISAKLRLELVRIYKLEGGRQIIEKCQEQALCKLGLHNRKKS